MTSPSVCVCYLSHPADEHYLQLSLEVMQSYSWVQQILVLDTNQWHSAETHGKVTRLGEPYGNGFLRQPELGGFDELTCRNRLLQLGYNSGCDWVLLMDADEIFLPATYESICQAESERCFGVYYECIHTYSLDEQLWFPAAVTSISGTPMHDPHLRALRKDLRSWYILHKHEEERAKWPNRTMHCYIEPQRRITGHLGAYHVHLHHLLPPKRPTVRPENLRPLHHNFLWPEPVLDAYGRASIQ